jgi:hypothetical protein
VPLAVVNAVAASVIPARASTCVHRKLDSAILVVKAMSRPTAPSTRPSASAAKITIERTEKRFDSQAQAVGGRPPTGRSATRLVPCATFVYFAYFLPIIRSRNVPDIGGQPISKCP